MPTTFEELELPKALLTRIVKSCLPEGTLLQKDAKAALAKATTVFISYLTATASDVANAQKHKNLNSEDVFQALDMLEFDQFIPSLREHLLAFQQARKEKKSTGLLAAASGSKLPAALTEEQAPSQEPTLPTSVEEALEKEAQQDE